MVYHTSLANVDYLHGSAEFLLTLTNLFIVLGLRQGIRQVEEGNRSTVGEALMKEEAAQRSTTE